MKRLITYGNVSNNTFHFQSCNTDFNVFFVFFGKQCIKYIVDSHIGTTVEKEYNFIKNLRNLDSYD